MSLDALQQLADMGVEFTLTHMDGQFGLASTHGFATDCTLSSCVERVLQQERAQPTVNEAVGTELERRKKLDDLVEHALYHWRRYETAPTVIEAQALADELLRLRRAPGLAAFCERAEGSETLAVWLEDRLEDNVRETELCAALAIHLRVVQNIGFAPGLAPAEHRYVGNADDREPCQLEYEVGRKPPVSPFKSTCRQMPDHPIHTS